MRKLGDVVAVKKTRQVFVVMAMSLSRTDTQVLYHDSYDLSVSFTEKDLTYAPKFTNRDWVQIEETRRCYQVVTSVWKGEWVYADVNGTSCVEKYMVKIMKPKFEINAVVFSGPSSKSGEPVKPISATIIGRKHGAGWYYRLDTLNWVPEHTLAKCTAGVSVDELEDRCNVIQQRLDKAEVKGLRE